MHCALTDETKHLINEERLAVMKDDAILVNASRGPVIDETALVKHLKANPNFRSESTTLNVFQGQVSTYDSLATLLTTNFDLNCCKLLLHGSYMKHMLY